MRNRPELRVSPEETEQYSVNPYVDKNLQEISISSGILTCLVKQASGTGFEWQRPQIRGEYCNNPLPEKVFLINR
jgi:hypothetical protein